MRLQLDTTVLIDLAHGLALTLDATVVTRIPGDFEAPGVPVLACGQPTAPAP